MTVSRTNSATQNLGSILKRVEAKQLNALPKYRASLSSNLKQNITANRFATTLPGTTTSHIDTTGQAASKNSSNLNNALANSATTNVDPKSQNTERILQNTSNAILSFKALKESANPSKAGQKVAILKQSNESKTNSHFKQYKDDQTLLEEESEEVI